MIRSVLLALLVIAPGMALASPPGAGDASADSARAALARELDLQLGQIERGAPARDPFEDGRVPDLLILSSSDVQGEVAPCG